MLVGHLEGAMDKGLVLGADVGKLDHGDRVVGATEGATVAGESDGACVTTGLRVGESDVGDSVTPVNVGMAVAGAIVTGDAVTGAAECSQSTPASSLCPQL